MPSAGVTMAAMPHKYGDRTSDMTTPLTLIGYWQGKFAPGWPRVTDFVDENWDQRERRQVAQYLQQEGFRVPWRAAGASRCRFCGVSNGSTELTDGVYLWPDGLAHYVSEHGVRLPVSVIRHILSRPHRRSELVREAWWKTATLDS
jgi:hypothetical protein